MYFGDVSWLRMSKSVTISVRNESLVRALDICFKDQPLTYQLLGNGISITAKEQQEMIVLHGKVIDEKNEPIPGVTIQVKGMSSLPGTLTNDSGSFTLKVNSPDVVLVISSINYEGKNLPTEGHTAFTVQLKTRISELKDATVTVNNGYQGIPKERATGSFTKIDNELINRRVSTSILDRIDGVASSVIFNTNTSQLVNQSPVTIRGRSTINGNPDALVVIDNFPYSGDITNINPDDVESITILKDAASASIWGAFSGNGVIVITTKKGKYNQKPRLNFNTSLTAGAIPNLNYQPILSSSDYVDVESYLFHNGFYGVNINSPNHLILSPAVAILLADSLGTISDAQAQQELAVLKGQDTRKDVKKYFYRTSWNQQYSLNYSGGTERSHYFLSGGLDKNLANLVRNGYNRVTLNGTHTYSLIPKHLEFTTNFAFTASTTPNNNSGISQAPYPYQKLADGQGNALAVPYQFPLSYVDTAGGGKLLDWHYRPLDEMRNADYVTKLTDYRLNLGLKYIIIKGLSIEGLYQYGHGITNVQNYQSLQTYYTRNLINEFTQIGTSGNLSYPVPKGGILDQTITTYNANNVRLQVSYDTVLPHEQEVSIIGGTELRDVEGQIAKSRLYGYDNGLETSQPVDYTDFYSQYSSPGATAQIPYMNSNVGTSDRYLSYYINGSYTYKGRYILSGSARRDESNIFGVNANQKGVPLWSVGGAWEISREPFYTWDWLPFLKLRVTNGYNGNVDKSVSAYTTVFVQSAQNIYGQTYATITNPPNPDLRWERINILNTGLDFGTRKGWMEGSIEYYIKSGKDLIGQVPEDPTTGVTYFTGNTANMLAHGVDINLHLKNTRGVVQWNGILLFSYILDKVTSYGQKLSTIDGYLYPSSVLNPVVGRPLYSVNAYRWEGLDPQTGDPQGLLNQGISKDYSGISNSSDFSNLLYKGPVNPPFFGSFRNSVGWKQFSLSCNIVYKLGFYFRRNSIHYYNLFNGDYPGHPDYDRRWMKPGDEKFTYVPSMVYPPNLVRDNFYTYSEVLVVKGDFIRLQDLQFGYDLPKRMMGKLPVQTMRFYIYANNIGLLWKANHFGIDPDFQTGMPNPRTLSVGLKMGL